ncbi:SEC-C domain-containing protein [Pseudomonas sp. ZY71]|uniref:SEC-C domain-containing protein n=1 Tax=Pseudomonas sp. ZY71 TaxID=3115647 RepID=UPI002F42B8DD
MSSILITNKVANKCRVKAKSLSDEEEVEFFYGFLDKGEEVDAVVRGFVSAFFMSLVTHDDIYLKPGDLGVVLSTLGAENTLKLLDRKIVKVVFGADDFVVKSGKAALELSFMKFDWAELEGFEERLPERLHPTLRSRIVQYVDNSSVRADGFTEVALSELNGDFSRQDFRSQLDFKTSRVTQVDPHDGYRILRVSECAQSLIIQNKLSIDSIYQDAYVKDYANAKLGAFRNVVGSDPIEGFEKVIGAKGIPDIYYLYSKGVVSLDDILVCRESFNGSVFRKWYSNAEFDGQLLMSALLTPVKQSAASRFIRLIYPNVIGVLNPFVGLGASVLDSYLVDKLVGGWRPSLFLDDVLKTTIDEKIRLFDRKSKMEEFVKRFGSIDRNESCPCQSGKKFKRCHGA